MSATTTTTTTSTSTTTSTTSRLPVLFLSHGAGPCFYMDKSESHHPVFNNVHKDSDAAAWYRQISTQLRITTPPDTITDATERLKWQKPKAILVISAHWESKDAQLKVTTQERYPSLLYDYGGFPEHTYRIQWPAPGAPMLAKQVQSLLAEKGFIVSGDEKRNLDHGTFIPLGLVYPAADIPTIQLTVQAGLNPENHLKIGEALAPLREQGVLIVGSGSTTHGRFTHSSHGREWVNALTNVLTKENSETRRDALVNWIKLPHAREAHGREEHLIPLHVAVGAAGNDVGTKIGDFWAGDMSIASYAFGA